MDILFVSLALLVGGGFLSLALGWSSKLSRLAGMWSGVAGGVVGLWACIDLVRAGASQTFAIPWPTAGITIALHVDTLALFFLAPIFLLTLACAVYATSYLHATTRGGQYAYHWFFFNLLAASMALVVIAANGLFFLVAWEIMALSSFFLVTYDYANEEVRRAGWLYLIATHCGTVFLFMFFLLCAGQCGSFDFVAFTALKTLPQTMTMLLFGLALIGFGTKAGLFPLHVWLPDAHPAAPSHVSALMSGVMIKTGIYGIMRMLTWLAPLPAWGGAVIFTLGIIGALFGIAMAAGQTDIKRSLAFSSVENIGIIFLGIGVSLFASAIGQPAIAVLAMTGAMLHIWNHALFKGLLFLGAGSLIHATTTRELSLMGGLLRRMPITGSLVIAGSLAICALPPLNGFVSEWFIYLGLLKMGQVSSGSIALLAMLLVVFLALVGGLVLITFSRLVGIALLGEPRCPEAASAHEAHWTMLTPMAVLMACCLLFGLYPALVLRTVSRVVDLLLPGSHLAAAVGQGEPLSSMGRLATLLLVCITTLVMLRWQRAAKVRRMPTWGCGFPLVNTRMAYTAGGYAELAQRSLLCVCLQPKVAIAPPVGLFPQASRLTMAAHDLMFSRFFQPLFRHVADRAITCRGLQAGLLHIYILYIFIATALLLGLVLLPL